MLVLITYDVNTESPMGKVDFGKWQNSAKITEGEFKILYLSVSLIKRNA